MPIIPPVSASGILRFNWVDPGGTTRDLTWQTSPRLFVARGGTGLGMAAVEFADDKIPYAGGSLLRHVNVPPRRIELPIVVREDSIGDLILTVDDLREWFGTADERVRTPGYLRVTRPDGTIRKIAAYYAGGLDGDMGSGGVGWTQYVVSLYCPDPWPTADEDTVLTYTTADLPTFSMINQGEIDAYPIWTITGPCAVASGANVTTSKSWTHAASLAAGESLTIDTRPASLRTTQQVYDDTGANRYSDLNPASALFWLAPGQNDLAATLTGTTSATEVELRYLARYRGLLR